MSEDGHWADNPITGAALDVLNAEIHITWSTKETSTITFRPMTDNPT